jgi:hypothetical protein
MCADEPIPVGVLWKCCVCSASNGMARTACVNCHHERGGEPIALRWNPKPSAARFEPPAAKGKS